jgi:hypothetical protein
MTQISPSLPRTARLLARSALLLAGLLMGVLGLAGCKSTPSAGPAHPQRVAWADYRTGVWLELVNETHTGRVEQYSELRTDASRKVQTDEIIGAFVQLMRDEGFADHARPGPAPRGTDGQVVMALELADGDKVEHMLAWKGMPAEERKTMLSLAQNFADLFNATYGLQAVAVDPDKLPFENPVGPTKRKPDAVLKEKD